MKNIILFFIFTVFLQNAFALDPLLKSRLKDFRDPFKRNIYRDESKSSATKELKTVFSNRINYQNIPVEDIKITGVFLGSERRAIGQDSTKGAKAETFIIKEGMRLGPEAIEVKAILPGGIVLVEKITNVYDEEEYLETIIPVSD